MEPRLPAFGFGLSKSCDSYLSVPRMKNIHSLRNLLGLKHWVTIRPKLTHPMSLGLARLGRTLVLLLLLTGVFSCSAEAIGDRSPAPDATPPTAEVAAEVAVQAAAGAGNTKMAIFAGGCFWCMEKPFDQLPGVRGTISGYTGGSVVKPSYGEVSGGGTAHREAVKIIYDPTTVTYEKLLSVFWHNVDPLDSKGQFCDKGSQYTSAIFVADEVQKKAAEASKQSLDRSKRFKTPIVTPIIAAAPFYAAEDYHQNYYQTNAAKYKFYRFGCGRDRRLEELWGKEAGH